MLDDGTYGAVVIDADDSDPSGRTRIELAIASGEHRGAVVTVTASAEDIVRRDPLDLLGLPATITVAGGHPTVTIDD